MKTFCTYLTIYKGNKLPPFYIGSTSCKKIEENSYHGTVLSKKYKELWISELKENPQFFKTKIISTHLTRKDALVKELFFQEALRVVESPLYINMSYARKNGWFGIGNPGPVSEETRKKISAALTGKKRMPHTEEAKRKMSLAATGRNLTEGTKQKISAAQMGNTKSLGKKHTEESKIKMSLAKKGKPNNWVGRQHTKETKRKMSLAVKGKKRVYLDDGSYTYQNLSLTS